MVFSSAGFLVYFLPILLAVYFAVRRSLRNAVLLAASLLFYGWGGPRYLLLLVISIAVDYLCGLLAGLGRSGRARRLGVVLATAVGIGLLGWFKYAGFAARQLVLLGVPVPIPAIALPIGISFYTFQGLSYVIDVYRDPRLVQRDPLQVALYISLFPQLVAGPIVRYAAVAEELRSRRETLTGFSSGAMRFCFGLGKKMLLANALGQVADAAFSHGAGEIDLVLAWVGIAAYTGQIYFDFSAYSDMAIGLGRIFGFSFPENFDYPYIARSVTEFWRRWHISLSSWFRDYVYIPLGGSRCSRGRHLRNILAVWLLTGLWHGANWTFIAWGGWFAVLLVGEKFLWGGYLERLPGFLRHALTLLAVAVSWVLFRSDSLGYAFSYLGALFGANGIRPAEGVYYLLEYLPEFAVGIVAAMPVKDAARRFLEQRSGRSSLSRLALQYSPVLASMAVLVLSYMELASGSFNPFIYFQF